MPAKEANFNGLRVASLESRRAEEISRMIERLGGQPYVSPSMREVPLQQNPAAVDFAHQLITGQIDILIFMTGVGVKHLLAQVERHVDRARFLSSIEDMTTIARGPKPVAALKELGITPTFRVPEPNTWRELLALLDEQVPVGGRVVGLQEYGIANTSLIAGLEARGAEVHNLKVYNWDFPEDPAPLEANIRRLAEGELDVVMFTSATQVQHMLKLGEGLDLTEKLRQGFNRTAVVSIGPTTSEMLRSEGLPVDIQPVHNKMGHMVQAAAERAQEVLDRKTRVAAALRNADQSLQAALDTTAPWHNSLFLRACRCEPVERTPIWLMRQAGRYMQEYREVRAKTTFLELCKNPQLCSEVMCTAVERLGVDAAIIFSDLLPILEPMGMDLEFAKGEGPVIHNPVREASDVDRLLELESVDALHFVMETVRQTRTDLPDDLPLIGFSGAPFTLASYAIEGGASRSYLHTKTLMYRDPGAWRSLMERFVRAIVKYLNAQIACGAQAVQIFDSWVGCLSPDDYREYVLPYMKSIFAQLAPGIPVINFGTGNPQLLPLMAEAGGSVIGVDWRIRLDAAWQTVGHERAVQGNLEPLVLLADHKTIRTRVQAVLDQAAGRPGHIFNLGHGIVQQTPVENAIALVELVHELSSR